MHSNTSDANHHISSQSDLPCGVSRKNLIAIPHRTLKITKEKASFVNNQKNVEKKHKNPLKKLADSSPASLPVKDDVNTTYVATNATVCRTGRERTVDAKPALLTPRSATKILGPRSHLRQTQAFPTAPPKPGSSSSNVRSNITDDSTSFASTLSRTDTNDSLSVLSDSSYSTDDVDKTMLCSIPDSLNDDIRNLDIADSSINFGHLALSEIPGSSRNTENMTGYPALVGFDEKSTALCDKVRTVTGISSYNHLIAEPPMNTNQQKQSVQISPSISLPVTNIEGIDPLSYYGSQPMVSAFQTYTFPKASSSSTIMSWNDDESVSTASDVSNLTCSSMSFDQEGLMLMDSFSSTKTLQVPTKNLDQEVKQYKKEVVELKQSLKLAQADTAILVSSKQQLQLEQHELHAMNNSLRDQLQKTLLQANETAKNLAVLTKTQQTNKGKFVTEINILKGSVERMKNRMKNLNLKLEITEKERDRIQSDNSDIGRILSSLRTKNDHLQKEVSELLSKNSKLDALLQRASEDSSGNHEYINSIRHERDTYARRVHERDQEAITKQLAIKQLEEKVLQLSQANSQLLIEQEKLVFASKEKDSLISSLRYEVTSKSNEKKELDGAVSRLHGDLHRVEAGFTNIKREIAQKSGIANQELHLKSQMEDQICSLKEEVKQLKTKSNNYTLRISDKNNQIAQLLNQLQTAASQNTNVEKEVKDLKLHINQNEESWVKSIEREKYLTRNLDEKSAALLKSENSFLQLTEYLNEEKLKRCQAEEKSQTLLTTVSTKNNHIDSLNNDLQQALHKKEEAETQLHSWKDQCNLLQTEVNCLAEEKEELYVKNNILQTNVSDCLKENMMDDSLDEPHPHMHLLAELQSSNRELHEKILRLKAQLKHENDRFDQEKKTLTNAAQKAEMELQSVYQNYIDQDNKSKATESRLKQKTDDMLTLEAQSMEQLSALKAKSSNLESNLDLVKSENECLKTEMDAKSKEIQLLSKRNKNISEELCTVKEEMNSATLRLLEEINQKENDNDLRKQLILAKSEGDKLREAVQQQQRYLVALQIHYQQWAQGAAKELEKAQAAIKPTQDFSDIGTQTSHDEVVVCATPSHPRLLARDAVLNINEDANCYGHEEELKNSHSTYTDHDSSYMSHDSLEPGAKKLEECPNCHMSLKPLETTFTLSESAMPNEKHFKEVTCQTYNFEASRALRSASHKPKSTSSTQTDHTLELVGLNQYSMYISPQVDTILNHNDMVHISVQTDEVGILSNFENSHISYSHIEMSTQTEHDAEPVCSAFHVTVESDVAKLSTSMQTELFYPEVIDVSVSSTQTDEESLVIYHSCDTFMESSTQTDHESEPLCFGSHVSDQHRVTKSSTCVQTELFCAENVEMSSGSTQTDQNVFIVSSYANFMEAFTQTDHDTEPVFSANTSHECRAPLISTCCQTEFFYPKNIELCVSSTQTCDNLVIPSHSSDIYLESSTQTDHEAELVCSADHRSVRSQVLKTSACIQTEFSYPDDVELCIAFTQTDRRPFHSDVKHMESSTQTDHDAQEISHNFDTSLLLSECSFKSCLSQTDSSWEANISNVNQIQAEDSFTQTDNLRCPEPVPGVGDCGSNFMFQPQLSVRESSTQTCHDDELAMSSSARCNISPPPENCIIPTHLCSEDASPFHHTTNRNYLQISVDGRPFDTTSSQTEFTSQIEPLPAHSSPSQRTSRTLVDTWTQSEYYQETKSPSSNLAEKVEMSSSNSSQTDSQYDVKYICENCKRSCAPQLTTDCAPDLPAMLPTSLPVNHVIKVSKFSQTNETNSAFTWLPPLPSAKDVVDKLNSSHGAKLKAYKKTVKLLKEKLGQAEKQSILHQEQIKSLQIELELMRTKFQENPPMRERKMKNSLNDGDHSSINTMKDECNGRLQEEINHWKDVAESNGQKFSALEMKLQQLKKLQQAEVDKMKRSGMADRMQFNRKLKELNERIKSLLDVNGRLRKSMDKLQIKFTNTTQQLEICRREKLRYQHRARKLQANLRSLSWIASTSAEQSTESGVTRAEDEQSSSVSEIEDLLKNLRSEISVLEVQLTHHSTAVEQSNAVFKELRQNEKSELRRSSTDEFLDSKVEDDANLQPSKNDVSSSITQVV
ncbi:uncharacterized protein LOC143448274 [Clavelina lepadiformis]|uniref:uncharacterized protein LOC143448274 n=1 Tax=Clavelina lepadiformis TaxID=159417 RepID=UPI00404134AE